MGRVFRPRFLYPFHSSKGIPPTFGWLLFHLLKGRRIAQIEHDDSIAKGLHRGTAATERGHRIAQRFALKGIMQLFHRVEHAQSHVAHPFGSVVMRFAGRGKGQG